MSAPSSHAGGPLDPGGRAGLLGPRGPRRAGEPSALRSTLVALVSTVVFFGIVGWIVVSSPGWPAVQVSFLSGKVFASSFPSIVRAFSVNVQLFLIAEVLILALGLAVAVLRSLPGPVLFPVRLLATAYVDVFRALPGVLVIYILGFGIPGLGLAGVPIEPFFYAVVALTLVY